MSPRERLAAEQAALLAALLRRGPCPPGFDAARVRAAGNMLEEKRLRAPRRVSWLAALLARFLG